MRHRSNCARHCLRNGISLEWPRFLDKISKHLGNLFGAARQLRGTLGLIKPSS
jgi:hypothetical protein